MIALKKVRLMYPVPDPGLEDIAENEREFFTNDEHRLTLADFYVEVEHLATERVVIVPLNNVRYARTLWVTP